MKIKIIANPKKPWAKEVASNLNLILSPKHSIVRSGADATICVGGDGTILYACHKNQINGPILGIGGAKSYICQLRFDNYKDKILGLLDDSCRENLLTLVCTINNKKYQVLNDVVVHATRYRVAEMDVTARYGSGTQKSDSKTISFEGDGIIVSSSVGSAAYAYSAGGEKFKPTERKLVLVPICPYKRAMKSEVLNEGGSISIKVGADCAFIVDGIFIRKLRTGEIVNVEKGSDMIFFSGVGNNE